MGCSLLVFVLPPRRDFWRQIGLRASVLESQKKVVKWSTYARVSQMCKKWIVIIKVLMERNTFGDFLVYAWRIKKFKEDCPALHVFFHGLKCIMQLIYCSSRKCVPVKTMAHDELFFIINTSLLFPLSQQYKLVTLDLSLSKCTAFKVPSTPELSHHLLIMLKNFLHHSQREGHVSDKVQTDTGGTAPNLQQTNQTTFEKEAQSVILC